MDGDAQKHFKSFVDAGNPVGEVIAVDSFRVQAKGLQPVNTIPWWFLKMGAKASCTIFWKTG